MKTVHDRIRSGDVPQINRRNFLRLGGFAAAGLAVAPSLSRPNARSLFRQEMSGEIVDLSHVLSHGIPLYSLTDHQPTYETLVTVQANGFYKQLISFDEHSATHMDAPAHFDAEGVTVDNLDPHMFVAPAVVIDISAKAAEDPDAMVTPDDLTAWEAANGEIPAGALVCMYSGWESRWPDVETYRNPDADGVMHFPGFHGDAAKWLVEERDIVGIGVDTLSLDHGASTTFDTHLTILPAGKYGLENLRNLSALMGKAATIMVGIPRYQNGSGGPCRVLAMI
jgi:kynurenine formamidase